MKNKKNNELAVCGFAAVKKLEKNHPEKITRLYFTEEVAPKFGGLCKKLAKAHGIYNQKPAEELQKLCGVISDYVKKIAVLRDAAVELKNAIKDGKEFYIPIDIVKNEPAAWPLASGAGVFTLDCGKLFTAGQFAIDKLIELDSKNKPVFYANGQKITSSDKFVKLLEETETEIQLSINILAAKSLYEVINIPDIPSQIQPVKFSGDMYMIGIFLYNYYYGGFEKAIDEMRGEDGSIAFFQNY